MKDRKGQTIQNYFSQLHLLIYGANNSGVDCKLKDALNLKLINGQ